MQTQAEAARKLKRDISPHIAYPKSWQADGKWNDERPYKQYPFMPLIVERTTLPGGAPGMPRLVPVFLDREKLHPLTFETARQHADYLKANPEWAKKFAEAEAMQESPADKVAASNQAMAALAEKHKNVVEERNALEAQNVEKDNALAAARAELAAARAALADREVAAGGKSAAAVKAAKAAAAQS